MCNKKPPLWVITIVKRKILILFVFFPLLVMAQEQVVMHKPYIDNRRLHWGFFLGMNMMDTEITNNGYIDPISGEQWFAEVDVWNPGFTVGGLGELRLHKYVSLRFTPGIQFGQKHIKFHEQTTGRDSTQDMRCNYLTLPIGFKISAPRHNNFRPFFYIGASPSIKISNPTGQALSEKRFDLYLEFAMGCDIYLRYFKLIPELKFCLSLMDILDKNRSDLDTTTDLIKYTRSVDKMKAKIFTFTLYFE